jgi:hypothetical protein
MPPCCRNQVRLLSKRVDMGGANEKDEPMATSSSDGSDSLPGSLCADADSRRGSYLNTRPYVDVCPDTHRCAIAYLHA